MLKKIKDGIHLCFSASSLAFVIYASLSKAKIQMCDLYGIWTFILPSFSSPSLNLNMPEPTDKEPQETADSGIMSKSKLLEEQVGSNVAVKCCLSMFLHKCRSQSSSSSLFFVNRLGASSQKH